METLHSSLYAVAMACCLLGVMLTRHPARETPPGSRYLAAYLALESLCFFFEWLMVHPTSPGKSLWLGMLMSTSFLLGPCLWLYAIEISRRGGHDVRSPPRRLIAVTVLGVALTFPLMQAAHSGHAYAPAGDEGSIVQRLVVSSTMLASAVLFLLQAAWCLRSCDRILVTPKNVLSGKFVVDTAATTTLRILMCVLAAHWFIGLLRTAHCVLLGKDSGLGIVFAFMEVIVTAWAIASLARKWTTGQDERQPMALPVGGNLGDAAPAGAKYGRSALDAPARSRIQRKLQEAMEGQLLYRDSQLSLGSLCRHLGESPHYVSQVINQDLATTFHDLINRHRIEEAKAILVSHPARTILEIALEIGFNSKSTFNSAFRQHAGTTPSEFRQRHLPPH